MANVWNTSAHVPPGWVGGAENIYRSAHHWYRPSMLVTLLRWCSFFLVFNFFLFLPSPQPPMVFVIAGTSWLVLIYKWTKHTNHPTKVLIRKENIPQVWKLRSPWEKGLAWFLENCFCKTFLFWIYSSRLQRTQDPKCKLRFRFDVQICLTRNVTRRELTSSWLHLCLNFTVLI